MRERLRESEGEREGRRGLELHGEKCRKIQGGVGEGETMIGVCCLGNISFQ